MYSGTVRRVSRQDIKLVTVSLEMEDNNTRNDLHKECFYAGGLSAYVSWLNANKKPLHDTLGFRKEMDGTTMEIALQWCVEGYADTMLGFANSILTTGGGTHIDGVKASITRTLNRLAKKSKVFKGEDFIFSWDHVRKGLTCIISVIVPNLEFEGQTQTRLGNQYLREFVDQSVEEYLTEYFELHPDLLERIIAKSLNEYKTALYAKRERERELVRSRSVSMPCAVPEKLPNRSSEKAEITIGGGDSSGDAGKHVLGRLLQSKRTREQPRRNGAGQCLVNTSESSFEKKRIITENCVPSASAGFSSRRTAGSSTPLNRKDVSKKTPEDVANCKDVSKKTPEDVTNRKVVSKKTPKDVYVPIGPGFQAEIPVWIAPTKKGKFYGSPGDSDTLRWLGTGVWPTYSLKKQVHYKKVGEGRSDSCSCASPRTTDCIKQHVKEARELLEKDLGRAFYTWNFDQLGEVVSNSWTAKEEQRFEALVKKNPISSKDRFWEFLSKEFPKKSEKDLISYYQNVFLIKRMRSLVNSSADHIDSDDDQNDDFLSG